MVAKPAPCGRSTKTLELPPRTIADGPPYRADPRPCPRCTHREDVHEPYRGTRYCRHCEWIATVYPCSRRSVGEQQQLKSLSFDLDL
jgi:hypothetical protein